MKTALRPRPLSSRLSLLAAAAFALVLFGQSAPQGRETRPPERGQRELPPQHRDFLQLVTYIITPAEKTVFDQLDSDRDRDVFIASFWKLRDPTPETPENEYREEHLRRFQYANSVLGRSTGRAGWMTDMGRFHIILGKPDSYDRFPSANGLVPCEVWYYYTDGRKGLPTHFGLVFFQKGGIGEYKIYDPSADGPKALLRQTPDIQSVAPEAYEELYDLIFERAPTLADISISLVPGEFGYGYQPTPRNTILLAQIIESPRADIKPTYATHFLSYKGLVSTEYMHNYVEAESTVAVIRDAELDIPFLHYSVKPTRLNAAYSEVRQKQYCAFNVTVSLRNPAAPDLGLVYQSSRDMLFDFDPEEEGRVRSNGIAVEDAFPVTEGRFRLTILVQDAIGKSFSLVEQDLVVPAREGRPSLTGPWIGYRFQPLAATLHAPFKVLDKKLLIDSRQTLSRQDQVACLVNVHDAGPELRREGKLRLVFRPVSGKPDSGKTVDSPLDPSAAGPVIPVTLSFPASDLAPDYYEVEAALLDGAGRTAASAKGQVVISPFESIGHPLVQVRGLPAGARFSFFGILAQQQARLGQVDRADASYRRALQMKPDFDRGWADYALFLLGAGRFEAALEAGRRLSGAANLDFERARIRGRALAGLGRCEEAVEALLAANRLYDSDTSVLNELGRCHIRLGRKQPAIEALRSSLKLNPEQPEAKSLLAEAEKMRSPNE